jgi:hypothetical protein
MAGLMERGLRFRAQLIWLGLVVSAAAVFGQMRRHGFVSFDDGVYVYENPMVLKGLTLDGIAWAFRTFHAANWHPLTWLSHMLDVSVFGVDPGSHHLVSLALHAAIAVLVFQVLRSSTGATARSAAVAALFCLHPLHVESVAWIAERKDLVSTWFGMLSVLAYVGYARRPSALRYCGALLAFVASLMGKPMLVTLPFVLLLLDWWPLSRPESFRRLVWEKIPWFALTALSAVVTVVAQRRGGAVASLEAFPLRVRVANALVAYVGYLVKTIWPAGLSYFYPLDTEGIGWRAIASAVVLAAVSIAAVLQARSKPFLLVGWFWYLGTLLPVIGIVQVGSQAMADRYTYFPLIGLFIAAVWSVADRMARLHPATTVAAVSACLCALAIASWFQVRTWRSGIALYAHAVEVDPHNWAALSNLGGEFLERGDPAAAEDVLAEAVRLRPDNALAHAGLGLAFEQEGRSAEAAESMRQALALQPDNPALILDLGRLLRKSRRARTAVEILRRGLALQPGNAPLHYQLGLALADLGLTADSVAELEQARRLAKR